MLIRGGILAVLGITAPAAYLSDAGYSALAVVVSALITAAGGVLVAWITANGRRKADRGARPDEHPGDPEKEVPREKSS